MICKEVRVTERAHAGEEGRRRGNEEEKWITEVKVKKYRMGCRFSKKQNSLTFVQDVCFTTSSKFTERVRDSRGTEERKEESMKEERQQRKEAEGRKTLRKEEDGEKGEEKREERGKGRR